MIFEERKEGAFVEEDAVVCSARFLYMTPQLSRASLYASFFPDTEQATTWDSMILFRLVTSCCEYHSDTIECPETFHFQIPAVLNQSYLCPKSPNIESHPGSQGLQQQATHQLLLPPTINKGNTSTSKNYHQ